MVVHDKASDNGLGVSVMVVHHELSELADNNKRSTFDGSNNKTPAGYD